MRAAPILFYAGMSLMSYSLIQIGIKYDDIGSKMIAQQENISTLEADLRQYWRTLQEPIDVQQPVQNNGLYSKVNELLLAEDRINELKLQKRDAADIPILKISLLAISVGAGVMCGTALYSLKEDSRMGVHNT
ncbi:MAG: hypothetical protein V1702_06465 [Candidatus Woesearchaeota archaeon]